MAQGMVRPAMSSACRAGWEPVQTSARDPSPAASEGSSAARPGPKTTRPAVANSNGAGLLMPSARPTLALGRKDRGELRRGPWLGHHLGDGVAPRLVMVRVLVRGRRVLVPVDL